MGLDLCLDAVADSLLEAELTGADGHRDHDFRMRVHAFLLEFSGCGEDCTVLSLGNEREAHVETYAAVTHHRVNLVEGFATLLDFLHGNAKFGSDFLLLVFALGNELVQRRVEEAEHNGLAVHHAEGFLYSCLHEGFEFGKSFLALVIGVAEDHLTELGERSLGVAAVEHVLDTEEADTLCTELECAGCVFGSIGIGADTKLAELVAHGHELCEERVLGCVHGVDSAFINEALCTVEGQPFAFLESLVVACELHGLVLEVDLEGVAAYDAALAPATCNEGSVGGHTAAFGEDTYGCVHTVDVFRRGLFTDQDALLAGLCVCYSVLGGEDDLAYCTARRSGKTLCKDCGLLFGSGVEDGVENLVKLGGSHSHDGGLLVDEAFLYHVNCHLKGSKTGALADTALEHPKLAFLDGEFDILHILEVVFEALADVVEFLVNLGHGLFEGCEVLVLFALGGFVQGVRGADTCNHVFALGVDEPFTVELVVTVCRVAGECNAGSGGVTHVAEHHGLDVHCCSPVIRNVLDLTVADSALAVPGLEHAADGAPELGLCIVREFYAEDFLDTYLECLCEVLELVCGEFGVALVAVCLLHVVHHAVKLLADTLAVCGLNAFGLLHHDV